MAHNPEGSRIEHRPEHGRGGLVLRATLDPYGVCPDLPAECQQVGREYFARAPESDVWVWFGDLPPEVSRALWVRFENEPASTGDE